MSIYFGNQKVSPLIVSPDIKLNIEYSQTAPTDTSKLWIKANKPTSIDFSQNPEQQVEGVINISDYLSSTYNKACAAVGTDIYLFGGSSSSIYKFNTLTNGVTTLSTTLPTTLTYTVAIAVGTDIYLFGGRTTTAVKTTVNTIYKFNTLNETITTLSTTLPIALSKLSGAAVGTDIYLFGGVNASDANTIPIYKFDTLNESIASVSNLGSKTSIGCAAVGTDIYLFGGVYYGYSSNTDYNTIYKFNTLTNGVTTLSTTLPTKTHGISACTIGSNVYLLGGTSIGEKIYKFNTLNETITEISTTLSYGNDETNSAVTIGTKIYSNVYSHIQEFIVNFPLEENNILIQEDYLSNMFNVLTEPTKISVGVKNVYKGNSNNVAEFVDAYLYDGTNWVNVNTSETA